MPSYVVDSALFHGEGAVVNWDAAAKRLGLPGGAKPYGSVIELRWMLHASLGLPTGPFGIWARPHSASPPWQPLAISARQLLFAGLLTMITWIDGAMSRVSVDVQGPASGGYVMAFSGGPTASTICAAGPVYAGSSTVELAAPVIDGLLVAPGVDVAAVRGLVPGGLANTAGWTLVELAGLPVSLARWGDVGKQGEPQGLAGSFTGAEFAAVERLARGAPPFGWGPLLAAGIPAPAWAAPSYPDLVTEVNEELLDALHDIAAGFPPNQQATQVITVPLPPPENSSGQRMSGDGSTTELAPLPMTLMAACTDPFLSLVLGFGTAYGAPQSEIGIVGRGSQDFMITARWENGLDGQSGPADYAAVIPAPGPAFVPGDPVNLASAALGALRPLVSDAGWRDSVRVSWDRPPDSQLERPANFAAARADVAPAGPAVALMQTWRSGGYRPVAINQSTSTPDPEFFRLNFVDRELDIPASPGTRQVTYAAAIGDLYGQWSQWASVDQSLVQPDLEPVQVVRATLTPVVPASGPVCPAELELEFCWDWRVRSPAQVTFTGLMYPAADHGAPPPSLTIPAGLDRSLAGGGPPLAVTFSGDVPSAPGANLAALTGNGEEASGFGPAQGNDTRRYRLTLSGLALDFAATGFVGMAIWAQGQEQVPPQRLTPWSSQPVVISTGDPRPPVVPVQHVLLGSLPDATGSSHARIGWASQPNAVGYFVYEATEASFLDASGLPEPAQSDTLDQRLAVLKNAFRAHPLRRPFTRLNATAVTGTSLDVTLPRGSASVHLYVVLGVSAGQVESDWPGGPVPDDSLIALAAPHITTPAPPMIEVRRLLDTTVSPPAYTASLLVTTRPGPRPVRIDLHRVRVDDAARELDTMGPPVARLTASASGWTVTQVPDPIYGPYISTAQGADAPPGSWKRVWYRATAWTSDDATRGGLAGRSQPSNAAWVVLPPPDGPSIPGLLTGAGPGPADVYLEWTCASPVSRTPLGPHQITVRAKVSGAPPGTPGLLSLDATLDALPNTEPATGSGAWIYGTTAGVTTYLAVVRRAARTDAVDFAVRITDPLGRTGAQLLTIPAGPADPAPDLENLAVRVLPGLPRRTVLTFTSSSPVVPLMDGPYVLRVTGVKQLPFPLPPPPALTVPLPSVPTRLPVGPPPEAYILRTLAGPPYGYTVVTTVAVAGFVVRITGPDGQYVQKAVS